MLKFEKSGIILVLLILLLTLPACQNNKEDSNRDKANNNQQIVKETPDYTYSIMKTQIERLDKKYPDIKVSTIGKSHLNRNLYLLKLGKGEKKIAVVGGVHGREGLTSLLILKLLEGYVRHYSLNESLRDYNLNKILNETTFYFLPMINPDGVEIAVNGISNFENKNFYIQANEGQTDFQRWKANARGVDVNKQFKARWEEVESVEKPHYESYKGPHPESEPESKALASLTRKKDFSSVVCFHHSGRVIYWYYDQSGERLKRDYRLAKKISNLNGYQLVDPEDSEIRAAGYKDWFIKEFQQPGFTIEIGYKAKVEKPLSSSRLDIYFNENNTVLLELARSI